MNWLLQSSSRLVQVVLAWFCRPGTYCVDGAATPPTRKIPGKEPAPPCLKRAIQVGKNFEVNPATEEHCLSGLTRLEAEEMMTWIESSGFELREISFQEQTGYVLRWDIV